MTPVPSLQHSTRPTGLAYWAGGPSEAPTIVLLHGVGNNGSMWSDLAAALPAYRCVAPDLPGHGESRHLAWRSRSESARLVAELIEAEATHARAHVVGLSLGGSVGLELLSTRSDLLDHVIIDGCSALSSWTVGPMSAGVSLISPLLRYAAVARLIGRAFGVLPGPGLEAFVAQMRAVDPRSFRRAFRDANATRITPSLLTAACPTLFVAGERELSHVRASNRVLAEAMPRAAARMVPGANHGWGPAHHSDLHRQMILAWIEDRPLPAELVPEIARSQPTAVTGGA